LADKTRIMTPSNPHQRKNPIHLNEGFTCAKCDKDNPPAEKTCRNHCKFCLFSQHVDLNTPGDRQNSCNGLMEPVAVTYQGKKGQQIVHECTRCGVKSVNKTADDDDLDQIAKLMQRQNIDFPQS